MSIFDVLLIIMFASFTIYMFLDDIKFRKKMKQIDKRHVVVKRARKAMYANPVRAGRLYCEEVERDRLMATGNAQSLM